MQSLASVSTFRNLIKGGVNLRALSIALLSAFVLFTSTSFAANTRIPYQGRILRPDGSTIEGVHRITVKIYSPAPSLCLLWGEQIDATFSKGVFSVAIGDPLRRLSGNDRGAASNFNKVFANESTLATEFTNIDCAQGTSYTPGPVDDRTMVATLVDNGNEIIAYSGSVYSAPFALHANNSQMVGGYASEYIFKTNALGSSKSTHTFSTIGSNFLWDLAELGTVNLNGKLLKNAASPVDPQDLVNKAYVDNLVGTTGVSNSPQAANTVLAAPTSGTGLPTYRLLDPSDIPNLDAAKITSGTLPVSRGGTGFTNYTPYALISANMTGDALIQNTCSNPGDVLVWTAGGGWTCEAKTSGSGTVTNIGFNVSSLFNLTGGPSISTFGTFDLSLASQAQGLVLASPTGSAGVPTFRALSGTDLPILAGTGVSVSMTSGSLQINATGSGGTVTSVTGGTGLLGGSITSSGTLSVDVGVTDGKILAVSTGDKIPVSVIPNLDASIITTGTLGVSRGGTGLDSSSAANGQLLIGNGTGFALNTLTAGSGISITNSAGGISIASTLAGGTVTNVGFAASNIFNVTGAPITGTGTIDLSLATQAQGLVLASPTGATGVPSFRSLAGSDLPVFAGSGVSVAVSGGSLQISATGSGGTVTSVTAGTGLLGGTITGAGTVAVDTGIVDGKVVAVGAGDKIAASLIPGLDASIITTGTLGVNHGGTGLVPAVSDANRLYGINNAGTNSEFKTLVAGSGINIVNSAGSISISSTLAGGTVTNVGFAASNIFNVTGAPITGSGTIDLALANQAQGLVLASPTGATGTPSFRALAGSDLPVLAGSGVNVSLTGGSLQISATGSGGTVTSVTAGTGLLGGTITGAGTVSVDTGVVSGKVVAVGAGDKIAVSVIPNLDASILTSGTLGVNRGGTGLDASAAANGQILIGNGTGFALNTLTAGSGINITNSAGGISISSTLAGGTVTNVGFAASNIFNVTGAPVTGAGTIDLSLANQAQGLVLASPTGSTGTPSFRALAGTDLPVLAGTGVSVSLTGGSLQISATGSGGTVTSVGLTAPSIFNVTGAPVTGAGTIDVTLATQGQALVFASPTGASGAPSFRSLSATDIPSLDASKIGSGTLGINRGGTGLVPAVSDANRLYGIDNAGTASEFKSLIAGTGVTITHSAGSISISAAGSGGTVTNIGALVPSYMTVSPAAITSSGTFDFSFNSQAAGVVFAAPTGASGAPSFRLLSASDIPVLDAAKITSGTLPVSRGGTGLGSFTPYGILAANMTGDAIQARTCAVGQFLVWDAGTGWNCQALAAGTGISVSNSGGTFSISSTQAGGTVTNVGLAAPTSVFTVTNSPVTGAGTMTMSFANQAAATFFAAPTGATGTPSFRALASEDIPGLDASKITSGTLAASRGGTGLVPAAGNANQIYGVNAAGSNNEFKALVAGTGLSIAHTAGTITLSAGTAGASQWSNNSVGINYNSGSVGIGTSAPQAPLHIVDSENAAWVSTSIQLAPNLSAGRSSQLIFGQSEAQYNRGYLGFFYNGNNSTSNRIHLGFHSAADLVNILADGRVGIGTNAPSTALDIVGTGTLNSAIRIPRATEATRPVGSSASDLIGMMRYNTDTSKYEVYEGASWTSLSTGTIGASQWANNSVGINYNSGSVGIGTASPYSTLELRSSTPQLSIASSNVSLGANLNAVLAFKDQYNVTVGDIGYFTTRDMLIRNADQGISFSTGNTLHRLYINSGGSIGVGTNIPETAFHVVKSAGALPAANGNDIATFQHNGSSTQDAGLRVISGATGVGYLGFGTAANRDAAGIAFGNNSGDQSLYLNINNSAKLILKSDNRAGLNTMSPTAALDIVGTGTLNSAIRIPRATQATRPVGSSASDLIGMMRYNTDTSKYEVYEGTAWTSLSTGTIGASQWSNNSLGINYSSGSVGIGTSTPTAALDVSGSMRSNGLAVDWNFGNAVVGIKGTSNTNGQGILELTAGSGTSQKIGAAKMSLTEMTIGTGSQNGGAPLSLLTNNLPRMTITNNGHVGIGTSSPSTTLYVQQSGTPGGFAPGSGDVLALDNSGLPGNAANAYLISGDSSGGAYFIGGTSAPNYGGISYGASDTKLHLRANNQQALTIVGNTGLVGINNTSPTAGLDINTTGTIASAIRIPRDTTAMRPTRGTAAELQGMMRYNTSLNKYEVYEGTTGWTALSTTASSTGQWLQGGNSFAQTGTLGTNDNNALALRTNGTNAVNIQADGKVAIGAASTSYQLEVRNNQNAITAVQIGNWNANASASAALIMAADTVSGSLTSYGSAAGDVTTVNSTSNLSLRSTGSTKAIRFETNGANERVRIEGNGQVGIGTTTPTAMLDVVSNGTVGSAIRIPRDTTALRPSRGTAAELQGMLRYNTDLNKYEVYEGTTGWASLSTGTAASSQWNSVASGINYTAGSVAIGNATAYNRLYVGWNSGDSSSTSFFGGNNSSNNRIAVEAQTYSAVGVQGAAYSGYGGAFYSETSRGLYAQSTSGEALWSSSASGPSARFIASASTNTSPTVIVQQSSTSTADLQQWQAANSGVLMTVKSNGRVGIGTASPTVALDVALNGTLGSAIRFPRDTTAMRPVGSAAADLVGMMRYNTDNSKYEVYEGSAWVNVATGSGSSQWSTVSNGITYTSGSVGIGVSSPGAKLDVRDTQGFQAVFTSTNNTSGSAMGMYIQDYGLGTPILQMNKHRGSNSSPSVVNANDVLGSIQFQGYSGGGNYYMGRTNVNAVAEATFTNSSGAAALTFDTSVPTSATATERMRITSGGSVGIGTSSPTSRLTVAGAIESSTGGFKFPDGTTQTTAATGGGAAISCPTNFTAVSSMGSQFCIKPTSQDNVSGASLGSGSTSNVGNLISSCKSIGGYVCSYAQLMSANAAGTINVSATNGTGTYNGQGAFTSESMFYPAAVVFDQNGQCPHMNGSGNMATTQCSQSRSYYCCR